MKILFFVLCLVVSCQAAVEVALSNDSAAWCEVSVSGTTLDGSVTYPVTVLSCPRFAAVVYEIPDGNYTVSYIDTAGTVVVATGQDFRHESLHVRVNVQGAPVISVTTRPGYQASTVAELLEVFAYGFFFMCGLELFGLVLRVARKTVTQTTGL